MRAPIVVAVLASAMSCADAARGQPEIEITVRH
jgi:hypothetical protein